MQLLRPGAHDLDGGQLQGFDDLLEERRTTQQRLDEATAADSPGTPADAMDDPTMVIASAAASLGGTASKPRR